MNFGGLRCGTSTIDDVRRQKFKNNFKIYIKIYFKTALTYFGALTPSSGSALFVLTKVTFVKIVH